VCSWAKGPVCHIVSGGDFDVKKFSPAPDDFVIAADCGYIHLKKAGFAPNLLLGDFDSLLERPEFENIIQLPAEKDDTDTLYAVKLGLEKGYRQFLIHGALGGERFDHTISNVQTLLHLTRKGAVGRLLGSDGTVITAIQNDKLSFDGAQKGFLSVFCMGNRAEGVTLSGVKYPLTDSTMTNDFPIGVSNEFIGISAEIKVKDGTLLIIWKE